MGSSTTALKMFRIIRLTRCARVAKLVRVVPELMVLIKSVIQAARAVFWSLCMLVSLIYIYGIVFCQLTSNGLKDKYFYELWMAMKVLLMAGTFFDSGLEILIRLDDESVGLSLLWMSYVFMAAFLVMNMLIGVLCQVIEAIAQSEIELGFVKYAHEELIRVMKRSGICDESAKEVDLQFTKSSFCAMMTNQPMVQFMAETLKLDVIHIVDVVDVMFASELDNSERSLSYEELVETLLELRSTNVATVKNIMQLSNMMRNLKMQVDEDEEKLNAAMHKISVVSRAAQE